MHMHPSAEPSAEQGELDVEETHTDATPDSDTDSFEVPPGLLESDDSDDMSSVSVYSRQEPEIVEKSVRIPKEDDFSAWLPMELMIEIFESCLPNGGFIRPISTQAPMVLCRVSNRWREIAINTTTLWSCLSLFLPANPSRFDILQSEAPLLKYQILEPPLTQLWLERSGGRSLSLDIGSHKGAEAALPYIERARDIILHPSRVFMGEFIQAVGRFNVQNLRLEHITVISASQTVLQQAFDILAIFPNLRSLNAVYPAVSPGWLQGLTRLKLYDTQQAVH